MNANMIVLDEHQLAEVEGGNPLLLGFAAYAALLEKIEKNPSDYTFLMDWYYN